MVAQLRIYQIHVDLSLSYVSPLGHFSKRARQVDNCVATIVLREEKDSKVLALLMVV